MEESKLPKFRSVRGLPDKSGGGRTAPSVFPCYPAYVLVDARYSDKFGASNNAESRLI